MVNYIDKALQQAAKDAYSINSVIKFFEVYERDYTTKDYNNPEKLECHYKIWMIARAGFKAGSKATIAFMNGGRLPDDFKAL